MKKKCPKKGFFSIYKYKEGVHLLCDKRIQNDNQQIGNSLLPSGFVNPEEAERLNPVRIF